MIDRMSLTWRMEKALLAGERVAAHVGQRRAHHGQIAGGDQNRALPEIDVERGLDLLVDDAEIEQQVRDGAVAVAGAPLRLVDGLVDRELAGRRSR